MFVNNSLKSAEAPTSLRKRHLAATGRTVDTIRATADETAGDIRETEEDEAMLRRALDLLGSSSNDDNEAALAALLEDTQWWEDVLA